EYLKSTNERAYQHEYLGIPTGTGGNVFDNVVERTITDEEIKSFGTILRGLDWGWYPDPFHYSECAWDPARRRLFIYDEYRCNKKGNKETAEELKKRGVTANDLIMCDSAENKSVADYRSFGLFARGAEKGPGSVDYSMKWLQSLNEIVIDKKRCPETYKEFIEYEYERTKDGEIISEYPDANNHSIDAVRYATSTIWRRSGK
ncbi:MAG: PBSX family phage terminase large subunit, partial [Huintestinicola sp.]